VGLGAVVGVLEAKLVVAQEGYNKLLELVLSPESCVENPQLMHLNLKWIGIIMHQSGEGKIYTESL